MDVNASQTISADVLETTNFGVDYGAIGITVTIAPGILVWSRDADGVLSQYSGSTLINNGNIGTGADTGVFLSGANSTITNTLGHSISGFYGIILQGDAEAVTNHGTIAGYQFY